MINIVLVEPEIPQNTGNIVRTCAATGSRLHLVRPLGFEVSDKYLKRAGLDYWKDAEIFYYDSFDEVVEKNSGAAANKNGAAIGAKDGVDGSPTFYFFTTKGLKRHCDARFKDGDFLVFGKETKGLPEELLLGHRETCLRIPMIGETRSLNLANSVAIAVYEALRQLDFDGFKFEGQLHRLKW